MEYITLMGSESVSRAAGEMSVAADQMIQASNNFSNALYDHRQFMNEWLARLQIILEQTKEE